MLKVPTQKITLFFPGAGICSLSVCILITKLVYIMMQLYQKEKKVFQINLYSIEQIGSTIAINDFNLADLGIDSKLGSYKKRVSVHK